MHCIHYLEMWLSLVERCVRDAEVAGSNPVISTIDISPPNGAISRLAGFLFLFFLISLNKKQYKITQKNESMGVNMGVKFKHKTIFLYCIIFSKYN